MNLNYKILWYDDDKDFFESLDKEPIEDEIRSWGFNPQIIPVHNAAERQQHAPFSQFDMLVVDFDLGDNEHGDAFIKSVRDNGVYAEIIFYSAVPSSDLWLAIYENKLEGVFVSNKQGIPQKIFRVAKQSVQKVLDLENMRGIVMSEVGELDELLERIFTRAMQSITEEQQQKVFKSFIEKSKEPDSKFDQALAAFEAKPSIDGLKALCDGSDQRFQNVERVKKHHPALKDQDFTKNYRQDILSPRNFLAHGVAQREADGSYSFSHRGREYVFNDEVSRALRKTILDYKNAFAELAETLAR